MFAQRIRNVILGTLATLTLGSAVFAQSADDLRGLFKLADNGVGAFMCRSMMSINTYACLSDLPARTTSVGAQGHGWGAPVEETLTPGGELLTMTVRGFDILMGTIAPLDEAQVLPSLPGIEEAFSGRLVSLGEGVQFSADWGYFSLDRERVLIAIMESIPQSSLQAACADDPNLAQTLGVTVDAASLSSVVGIDGAEAPNAELRIDDAHGILLLRLSGRKGGFDIVVGQIQNGMVQLGEHFDVAGTALEVDFLPLVEDVVNR